MAVDRQRLAEALAYEEQKRRMMESVPTVGNLPPAQPARRSLRTDLENLSSGLGRGIVNQLEGVKGLVTDPVGTVKGAYEGVKGIVRDPSVLADALRYTADKAISGPLGAGEVVGEFLTPSVKGVGKRDIFIGKKAETWRESAAKQAEEMEAAGIDPETIWRETGTMRGPDGELRQEISDLDARLEFAAIPEAKDALKWADDWLKENGYIWKEGIDVLSPSIPPDAKKAALEYGKSMAGKTVESVPLQRVFSHPEFSEAYPDLYNELKIAREPSTTARGRFQDDLVTTGGGGVFFSGKEPKPELSTLLHELQHAIQQREGFSRGGNPDIAKQVVAENYAKKYQPLAKALAQRKSASMAAGEAYRADYAHKLRKLQTSSNLRPKQLRNNADWYQYSDEVKDELSRLGLSYRMPTKKGAERDHWINEAVRVMQNLIERDRPEMRGAAEKLTEREAKNQIRRADTIYRKTQAEALQEAKLKEELSKFESLTPFDLYQRLGGEAESRLVQSRMDMPVSARRQTFPEYDVPRKEIINRK